MMTADVAALVRQLGEAAGTGRVLTGRGAMRAFLDGYRTRGGDAVAVVRPATLAALWRVLNLCAAADAIVILQAANTSLTGGSVPATAGYDRPVVLVNTLSLGQVHLINDGREVICLPGATLYALEQALAPLGREPHSVIGSSCLGASVIGGVCNNSGGALVRRGPAFTAAALFARTGAGEALTLVNHLGIDLPDDPSRALDQLQAGTFARDVPPHRPDRTAPDYREIVCNVDADTPARHNADPQHLFEASGCAGKLAVLAVRLPTFPKPARVATLYVATDRADDLTALRRDVFAHGDSLPIIAEYADRATLALTDRHGGDTIAALRLLGTARMPALFRAKARLEGGFARIGLARAAIVDRVLQFAGRWSRSELSARLRHAQRTRAHFLLVQAEAFDMAAIRAAVDGQATDLIECTPAESAALLRQRFAAAGAAARMSALRGTALVPLDVALRRNDRDWGAHLPPAVADQIVAAFHYGHFMCHVFHRDYVLAPGADPAQVKAALLAELDDRGARYPAEHNVGHQYRADAVLQDFYRASDPRNMFNPGIGQTSRRRDWCDSV